MIVAAPSLNLQSPKSREKASYKATVKGDRKPGFRFHRGRSCDTFFWADLCRVEYDPDAAPLDEESGEPVEKLTLTLHEVVITIWGLRLSHINDDCQSHSVDFIRVSPREAVISSIADASKDDPPIITNVKIEKKKKAADAA